MKMRAFILVLIISCPLFSQSSKDVFKAGTLVYPPYIYLKEGELHGICIDLMNEIFLRMNVELDIRLFTWARALSLVEQGVYDAVFTTTYTEERALNIYYSGEALIQEHVGLFARSGEDLNFEGDLNRLKEYTFVVTRGYEYGDAFHRLLRGGYFKKIIYVDRTEQSIRMVREGRADIFGGSSLMIDSMISQFGFQNDIEMLEPELDSIDTYLAFSKEHTDSVLTRRYDAVLKDMKNTGVYDSIIRNAIQDYERHSQFSDPVKRE